MALAQRQGELRARVLTALVIGIPAIAAIQFLPTPAVALLLSVVLIAAVREFARLIYRGHGEIYSVSISVLVIVITSWTAQRPSLTAAVQAIGVVWWLVAALWIHLEVANDEQSLFKAVAGVLAFVPAGIAVFAVHGLGEGWLLTLLFIVWAADIGAYFIGKRFGVKKLAPSISPAKTWAGVVGGMLGGGLVSVAVALMRDMDIGTGVAFLGVGLLTVAASILGDLFESFLKRRAQCKDSGSLLPGHGGVLDRVDSLLAAAPVFGLGMWLLYPA